MMDGTTTWGDDRQRVVGGGQPYPRYAPETAPNLAAWLALAAGAALLAIPRGAIAQQRPAPGSAVVTPAANAAPAKAKQQALLLEQCLPELPLELAPGRAILFRTKRPIQRISVPHPNVVEVVQWAPTEFQLAAREVGETTLSLWFSSGQGRTELLRYAVRVALPAVPQHRTQQENPQK